MGASKQASKQADEDASMQASKLKSKLAERVYRPLQCIHSSKAGLSAHQKGKQTILQISKINKLVYEAGEPASIK